MNFSRLTLAFPDNKTFKYASRRRPSIQVDTDACAISAGRGLTVIPWIIDADLISVGARQPGKPATHGTIQVHAEARTIRDQTAVWVCRVGDAGLACGTLREPSATADCGGWFGRLS